MSNQIQTQASKVWQTVTSPETAAVYQNAGTLTWTILKETGYLLWLVICLVLVLGDWIWKTGYRTGYQFRGWINDLEKPRPDQIAESGTGFLSETSKNLLTASKTGLTKAIATAKDQLGIEDTDPPLEFSQPAVTPPAPPTPEPVKPATPPPAPSSAAATPASPSTTSTPPGTSEE